MKRTKLTAIENPTAIIASVYRSGSTWTAELLYRNSGPDCRDEIFAEIRRSWNLNGSISRNELRKRILQTLEIHRQRSHPNSWGFKLMTGDWKMFAFAFNIEVNTLDSLQEFFPDTRILAVTRHNLLEQALSLYVAKTTNNWHQYGIPRENSTKPHILDIATFLQCYQYISEENETLRLLIANSRSFIHRVCYEEAMKNTVDSARGMLLATMKTYLSGDQIYQKVPLQKNSDLYKNVIKDQLIIELLTTTKIKVDRTFINGL